MTGRPWNSSDVRAERKGVEAKGFSGAGGGGQAWYKMGIMWIKLLYYN